MTKKFHTIPKVPNMDLHGIVTGTGRKTITGLIEAVPALESKGITFRVVWITSRKISMQNIHKIAKDILKLLIFRSEKNLIFWTIFSKKLDFVVIQCASSIYSYPVRFMIAFYISHMRGARVYFVYRDCKYNLENKYDYSQKTLVGRLKARLARWMIRRLPVTHAALSPTCVEGVKSHFDLEKVYTLGSAPSVPDREIVDEEPCDPPMYMNIGNFSHRKGSDLFLEIAIRCLKKNPDILFCWVGKNTPNPSEVDEIVKSGFQRNFIFTKTEKVPFDLLRKSSGLIFTSRSDCYPKAVSEAFAMSRSVFCFEGTGGEFQVGKVGFVYDRFDTEKIAADILNHAEKPKEERINDAAFERFQEVLSSSVFAKNFEALVRDEEIDTSRY